MKKSFWYSILLSYLFLSCDYFRVIKRDNPEEVLREEWNKIDTTQVEEPPLFKSCESASEEDQEACFANTLHSHLNRVFGKQKIVLKKEVNDTIWISILIDKNNQIIVEEFDIPAYVQFQIPDFKTLINKQIASLPYVKSATKRGKPVSVRYKLPIVVKSE